MATNAERTEETRQRITDAFWTLAMDSGLSKVNVKGIMNLAGMDRSTFYEYYDNVDALLQSVENDFADMFRDTVSHVLENGIQKDRAEFSRMFNDMFSRFGKRFLFLAGSGGDPGFRTRMCSEIRPLVVRFYEVDCTEDELDILCTYIFTTMFTTISTYYDRYAEESRLDELYILAQGLMYNGISPYSGRNPFRD